MSQTLRESEVPSQYNLKVHQQNLAKSMKQWKDSKPKDIGYATEEAIKQAPSVLGMRRAAFMYDLEAKLRYKGSLGNLANGALARAGPLFLAGAHLSKQDLFALHAADCALTHCNPHLYVLHYFFAIVFRDLLHNRGAPVTRARSAIQSATKTIKQDQIPNADFTLEIVQKATVPFTSLAQLSNSREKCGFVRHSALRALHLWWNVDVIDFKLSLQLLFEEGGDTDTTACIVGMGYGCLFGSVISQTRWWKDIASFEISKSDPSHFFQPAKWLTGSCIKDIVHRLPKTVSESMHTPESEWVKHATDRQQEHQLSIAAEEKEESEKAGQMPPLIASPTPPQLNSRVFELSSASKAVSPPVDGVSIKIEKSAIKENVGSEESIGAVSNHPKKEVISTDKTISEQVTHEAEIKIEKIEKQESVVGVKLEENESGSMESDCKEQLQSFIEGTDSHCEELEASGKLVQEEKPNVSESEPPRKKQRLQ